MQHRIQYPANGETHAYREELLAGSPDTRIRIFVSDSMTTGETLVRLIERYPQNK